MKDAGDRIATQAKEDLADQGKKVAANMLLMYGGKACTDAGGFVFSVQSAHEAALLWLLSEGYVTLTDKATASEDEVQAKRNRRQLALNDDESTEGAKVLTGSGPGAYL